jgi:hypothetical protein
MDMRHLEVDIRGGPAPLQTEDDSTMAGLEKS